jgi:hypothetical protein
MNDQLSKTLYAEVGDITYDYLGPAADRFVTRQIRSHIGKNPLQLKKKDLKDLISWIKIAMSLLTNDEEIVDRYILDLKALTR